MGDRFVASDDPANEEAFMRGVILREFLDMVDRHFGPETTEHLSRIVGLTPACFSDASAFPQVLRLARALSERTGVEVREIILNFGQTVFPKLAGMHPYLLVSPEGPLKMLEAVIAASLEELGGLDRESSVPRIVFEGPGNAACTLEWHSGRPVADFAEGLLRGWLSYCRGHAEIRRTDLPGPAGNNVRFSISLAPTHAA